MTELAAVQPVIVVAVAYALGLTRMWMTVGVGRLVSRSRVALFALGLLACGIALGPLEPYTGDDLTLHMTQHMLLMYVAAPLLVLGAPFPTLLWALPTRARLRLQRRWQKFHRAVASDLWALWLGLAAAVQAILLWVWHLPALYDAAVGDQLVHVAEHASFLFPSIAFWWVVTGVVRRTRFGASVLAIFIAKFPGLFLGVGMTLALRPWYPSYGEGAAALRDQQGAGVVMWVGGGMIATVAGLVVFWHWMQALERAAPAETFRAIIERAEP